MIKNFHFILFKKVCTLHMKSQHQHSHNFDIKALLYNFQIHLKLGLCFLCTVDKSFIRLQSVVSWKLR